MIFDHSTDRPRFVAPAGQFPADMPALPKVNEALIFEVMMHTTGEDVHDVNSVIGFYRETVRCAHRRLERMALDGIYQHDLSELRFEISSARSFEEDLQRRANRARLAKAATAERLFAILADGGDFKDDDMLLAG